MSPTTSKFLEEVLEPANKEVGDALISLGLYENRNTGSFVPSSSDLQNAHDLIEQELRKSEFLQNEIEALKRDARSNFADLRKKQIEAKRNYDTARSSLRSLFGNRLVPSRDHRETGQKNNNNSKSNVTFLTRQDSSCAVLLSQDSASFAASTFSSCPVTPLIYQNNNKNDHEAEVNDNQQQQQLQKQMRLACVECEVLVGAYARLVVNQRNLNQQRMQAKRRQRTSTEQACDEKYSVLEQTLGLPLGTVSLMTIDTARQQNGETSARRDKFSSTAMKRDLEKHVIGGVLPVIEQQIEKSRMDLARAQKRK